MSRQTSYPMRLLSKSLELGPSLLKRATQANAYYRSSAYWYQWPFDFPFWEVMAAGGFMDLDLEDYPSNPQLQRSKQTKLNQHLWNRHCLFEDENLIVQYF